MNPPLVHLVRKAVGPAEGAPLVVLLHGVGSHEEDLFSLEDAFGPECTVVSARAPLTLRPGSYAWFPVQFTPQGPVIDAAAAEKSRTVLLTFLDWARAEYHAGPTVLAGFSQGAIMAASLALTAPEKIKGAALMSGRILPEVLPSAADPERLRSTGFLIVHGTEDDRLPVSHGRSSRETLRSLGVEPVYREFTMGHTITGESLRVVADWVRALYWGHASHRRS